MDAQDYPIQHFEQMTRLATALKPLPAQIIEHVYSYDSFGSWYTTIRLHGVVLRLIFDGKDLAFGIERSEFKKPPHRWTALAPQETVKLELDIPRVIESLKRIV